MNNNIKLISEISTVQSKRFYNNKQTLRPAINKNGQLNVIKTEVNKEELTYNEITLNKSTINQLKNGIYDSFGKNKFIPSLKNLNNLDEIYLREDDIEKIPALKWIYYPASTLNKNNPYICMLSNCLGAEAIIIIMVQEDFRSIKVVTDNIDLILWLDDIKYNYTGDETNLRSQTVRELNNFKQLQYNDVDYNEPLYEEEHFKMINGQRVQVHYLDDYTKYQFEVEDTPENVVKNKRNINKNKVLNDKLQRTKDKLDKINAKDYNLDDYLELFFNDKLVTQVSNYVNRGQDLYNYLSSKIDEDGFIIGTNEKRIDQEHGIGFKAVWVVYYELQKEELLTQIETLTNELNKLNIEA